jgi:AcrR family transcriptional regulator
MTIESIEHDRDTREHILSTAAQLFCERGFANVSIRDICEQAGITPPTIYHYFGNKDQLFENVIQKTLSLRGFSETLIASVEAESEPSERLCAFIRHYLKAFPRDFFNPGMFLQRSTQIYGTSVERVSSELQAIEQLGKRIIKQGIDAAVFRPVDPTDTVWYLMNLLMSYVLGEVVYAQSTNIEDTAHFIYDMFTNGLRLPI